MTPLTHPPAGSPPPAQKHAHRRSHADPPSRPTPASRPPHRPRRPSSPAGAGAGRPLPRPARRRARPPRASCPPPATARCTSACCTPTPASSSNSPPAPATPTGDSTVDRRRHREHYLPGGASGHAALAARRCSPTPSGSPPAPTPHPGAANGPRGGVRRRRPAHPRRRKARRGRRARAGCGSTSTTPTASTRLWAFLAERPCQLLIASGGSGGVHAYWKLDRPLPARHTTPSGTEIEPIERAHDRIIHALGTDPDGRPDVADPRCARTLARHAPRRHHQPQVRRRGAHPRSRPRAARLPDRRTRRRPPRPAHQLQPHTPTRRQRPTADPYKQIPPPEYFQRLAGITVPRGGLVSCPVPGHRDTHPSCSVGAQPRTGLVLPRRRLRRPRRDLRPRLRAATADLGPALRGDAFTRARARVIATFGVRS